MNNLRQNKGWHSIIHGNVLMMGLVSLFNDASSEMIYPLLPIFFTGLVSAGTVAVYIGLMEGLSESVASLLKIYSGCLSDALGKRKPLAVAGYGVSILCRPCIALATAGWHVVGLRVCDRVGKGLRTSPRDALISDSVDPGIRGLAFSFHRAMDHTGAIIGPLLTIAILYNFLGYGFWGGRTSAVTPDEMQALRWIFVIALIPGLLALITLVARVRDITPEKIRSKNKNDRKGDETRGKSHPLPRRFYFYLSTVALFTLGNSSDLFLVFYGKTKFHFGLFQIIGLWMALNLFKIIFSLPGGILSDKLGRKVLIITGWILYVLVYLGMAFVASEKVFWVLILLYGAYYGITEGAGKALVADYVPSEHRGRAYGLYHSAVGLATLPASLLFGVFWSESGPRLAFTIGAILAASAAVLLMVLLSSDQRQPSS